MNVELLHSISRRSNLELQGFLDRVASKALPCCVSTIKIDISAIYASLDKAAKALDPEEALL